MTEGLYAGDGRLRGWLLSAPDGTDGAAADPADPTALFYATEGAYQPTALATLPGGDVLALERRYTVADGPSARLLRITGAAILPGATLAGVELARLAEPLTVDNFEGLAVGRDASGRMIVTLVSDDNFNPLQRSPNIIEQGLAAFAATPPSCEQFGVLASGHHESRMMAAGMKRAVDKTRRAPENPPMRGNASMTEDGRP